jgi:prolyl-tRNA synthetase
MAIIAEGHHDENGLVWPKNVAPYDLHIIATGKDEVVFDLAESLAKSVEAAGHDVLYDDRPKVSPGVKFADAEVIGVPTILIVGRGAADGRVELWDRASGEKTEMSVDDALAQLTAHS